MQVSVWLKPLQHLLLGSLYMPSHTNLVRLLKGSSCFQMNSFSSAFRTVRIAAFSSATTTTTRRRRRGGETATRLWQALQLQPRENSCRIPTQLSARGLNVVLVDLLPTVDHQLEGVAVVLEGNPVGAVDLVRTLDGDIVWSDGDHL